MEKDFTQLSTRNYKAELHFLKIRSLLRLRKLQAKKCTDKLAGENAIVQTVSLARIFKACGQGKKNKKQYVQYFQVHVTIKRILKYIYIGRLGVSPPVLYTVQLYLFSVQDMSAMYNSSKCHILKLLALQPSCQR